MSQNKIKIVRKLMFAAAVSSVLASVTAYAEIEEIIVTAQMRAESLGDVPIAVSAFTDNFIEETKIQDLKQLIRYTPGLAGQSTDSFLDSISVRGVSTNSFGIGGDSSIGIYKDGIYYGRNGTAMTSFFDIERVEILKGPQGLLFGRNAASGAIHTITAKPNLDAVEGYVRVGAGQRDRRQAEFAYNQPLGGGWAARIAGSHSEEDGFVKNLFNGQDVSEHDRQALRLSIRNEGDWGDITLMGEYEDREQTGTVYVGQGTGDSNFTGDDRTANFDFPPKDEAEVVGFTLTANIHLNDSMTLTSITGYNEHDWIYQEDWDGSPEGFAGYIQDQEGDYFSQEVRLSGTTGEKLSWFVGASVYQEDVTALLANDAPDVSAFFAPGAGPIPLLETNNTKGEYSGWALYGDVTYQLTEKMDVSLGLRYTVDDKEAVTDIQGQGFVWPVATPVPVRAKQDWNDVSPRITLRYFTDNDLMFFGSVTEGYKSGGFGTDDVSLSAGGIALPGATLDDFDPETIRSYEVGVKGDLAEGRVKFGLSAYYYNYEDLQTVIIEVGNAIVENIGEVDGHGIELDLRAAVNDNWDVFLGAAWADTDISGIPLDVCVELSGRSCDGNRLAFNPEYTVSGGVEAHYPVNGGEVFAALDFTWQDEFHSGLENLDTDLVDSVGFVNFRAGWLAEKNWKVMLYAENLFDEESFSARGGSFFLVNTAPTRQRNVGVDVTYSF